MLDFGFSEILLTSAIALVVLGPEKLPKVARQVGNWMGRARLMARQLSEQLEREVSAEELLKQQMKIPPPVRVPGAAAAPPAALASPAAAEAVYPSGLEPPPPAGSEAPAAPAIAPEAVEARPRRQPHPNSPEMMHAKERMLATSSAAVQSTTTPAPTSAEPQQSSQ
jgi:sec-independent protein translocase protein TatB